jgi:hypothetical protein
VNDQLIVQRKLYSTSFASILIWTKASQQTMKKLGHWYLGRTNICRIVDEGDEPDEVDEHVSRAAQRGSRRQSAPPSTGGGGSRNRGTR